MKRKTVTAFLMSLCLAVSVPGTVSAADLQSSAADVSPQRAEDTVPQGQNEEKKEVSDSKSEEKEQTPAKERDESVQENTESVEKTTEKDGQEETEENDTAKKEPETSDKEKNSISQQAADPVTDIETKVAAAVKVKDLDMSSQVMKDFIVASNTYNSWSDSDKNKLSADTKNNMEVVRNRIHRWGMAQML